VIETIAEPLAAKEPHPNRITWIGIKNDDLASTRIRFAINGQLMQADAPNLPSDYVMAGPARAIIDTVTNGPEYETGPGNPISHYPAVAWQTPCPTDPSGIRPGNIPGGRAQFTTPAVVIT
jgi:hypothetical protein